MNRKKISCLIVIFLLCFSFCLNVKAISFTKGENGTSDNICYNRNNFEIDRSCSLSGHSTDHVKRVKGSNEFAYCATRLNKFLKNNKNYIEDTKWRKSNQCAYNLSGTLKGDCSVIAGFIINKALNGSNSKYAWFRAQSALWVYLKNFTPSDYSANNHLNRGDDRKYDLNDYKKAAEVLEAAWADYKIFKESPNTVSSSSNSVRFDVSSREVKFSYKASGNSCESSGDYITNNITITNNEGKTIHIDITNRWKAIKICNTGDFGRTAKCESEDYSTELAPGGKINIYLKYSATADGASSLNAKDSITLKIKASFERTVSNLKEYYNTRMYSPVCYKNKKEVECKVGEKDAQKMLTVEQTSKGGQKVVSHEETKEKEIIINPITHLSCQNLKLSSGNYLSENEENSPATGTCKANSNSGSSGSSSDYSVSFRSCTCKSISVNEKSVGILAVEVAKFQFGTFNLDNTYPGGGFGLDTSNENGSLTTQYSSSLVWQYADYDKNGNPYYFDSSSGVGGVAGDTIKNGVVSYLTNLITRNNVEMNVLTYDSNNSTKKTDYKTTLKVGLDNVAYDANNKKFSVGNVLKMNEAYFSPNSDVVYGSSTGDYKKSGGNNYYVPLKYSDSTFPYNIDVSNLSLTGWFKFYYKAPCNIEIIDYEPNYLYRTVDLEDPFPKTGTPTSANWAEWWSANINNPNRLRNTFSLYPENYIYLANLDDNAISKIISYDQTYGKRVYTDWTTVEDDGSNTFVSNAYGFEKVAPGGTNGSYCKIGEFNDSCDN